MQIVEATTYGRTGSEPGETGNKKLYFIMFLKVTGSKERVRPLFIYEARGFS